MRAFNIDPLWILCSRWYILNKISHWRLCQPKKKPQKSKTKISNKYCVKLKFLTPRGWYYIRFKFSKEFIHSIEFAESTKKIFDNCCQIFKNQEHFLNKLYNTNTKIIETVRSPLFTVLLCGEWVCVRQTDRIEGKNLYIQCNNTKGINDSGKCVSQTLDSEH